MMNYKDTSSADSPFAGAKIYKNFAIITVVLVGAAAFFSDGKSPADIATNASAPQSKAAKQPKTIAYTEKTSSDTSADASFYSNESNESDFGEPSPPVQDGSQSESESETEGSQPPQQVSVEALHASLERSGRDPSEASDLPSGLVE